jgi:hypothetical protein
VVAKPQQTARANSGRDKLGGKVTVIDTNIWNLPRWHREAIHSSERKQPTFSHEVPKSHQIPVRLVRCPTRASTLLPEIEIASVQCTPPTAVQSAIPSRVPSSSSWRARCKVRISVGRQRQRRCPFASFGHRGSDRDLRTALLDSLLSGCY